MKKVVIALLAAASFLTTSAQSRSDYDLVVSMFKEYYNHHQTEEIYGLFSERLKSMLTLDKTKQTIAPLYNKLGDLGAVTFEKESGPYSVYKSDFANATMTLLVQLNKDNKMEVFRFIPTKTDTAKSNFNLKTGTGTIYGTLTMPATSRKIPVVLIIAGSGPTDRDGDNTLSGKTNAYRMIADSLQKAGIACVRYDKRGVGKSVAALNDPSTMTFENIVNDAAGFVKMLRSDDRFSTVYVMGHSEGSLIGMIAAAREKADGFISVAGAAQPAEKLIERQYAAQSLELAEKAAILFDSVKKGYTVKNAPGSLGAIFTEAMQPYLRSWLKYDPSKEISKFSGRVLIVQGTTDMQVGIDQAKLLQKAYPTATLKIIDGMNHVLKYAPEDRAANAATYSNPDLPLCKGFMSAVTAFIRP